MKEIIKPIGDIKEHYKGRILRIITRLMKLPTGKEVAFEYAERPPGSRVIVINSEQHILLTKEWREEHSSWDYRLPGGKVFDTIESYLKYRDDDMEIKKESLKAAKKELLEEAGLNFPESAFNFIYRSVCGATIIWDLYYYKVEVEGKLPVLNEILTSEGENTIPTWVSMEDLKNICMDGAIKEDRSLAVLFKFIIK